MTQIINKDLIDGLDGLPTTHRFIDTINSKDFANDDLAKILAAIIEASVVTIADLESRLQSVERSR